ncbi:MAG: hypothetical protein L0Z50_26825 [Verrucomicrobiales bacterium]|nr:hypothetical protein [Verrucomicrobiales bacterium]
MPETDSPAPEQINSPPPITDVDVQAIDAALKFFNGSVRKAAAHLHLPKERLIEQIATSTYLLEKWPGTILSRRAPDWAKKVKAARQKIPPEALSNMQALQASPPQTLLPPDKPAQFGTEADLEALYAKAEAELSQGLTKLNLSESERSEAESLHSFYLRHGNLVPQLFGGSIARHGIRLAALMASLEADIEQGYAGTKKFTDIHNENDNVVMSGEQSKWDIYLRAFSQLERLGQFALSAEKVRILRAKLEMDKSGKGKRRAKPSFGPLRPSGPAVYMAAGSQAVFANADGSNGTNGAKGPEPDECTAVSDGGGPPGSGVP